MKLVVTNENNSVYIILYKIRLFLRINNNNLLLDDVGSRELLSYSESNLDQVGKILSTRDLRRMAFYFIDYRAATATILQNRLKITEPTTYRYMKNLRTFNFISCAIRSRLPKGKKGGPRSKVWIVPDATIEHVNDAQKLHRKIISPKYVAGERIGQLILEEYMQPRELTTITGREVMKLVRENGVKYSIADISDLAMNYLHERGMVVWR